MIKNNKRFRQVAILIVAIFFISIPAPAQERFAGSTKHKTVKKMKRHQVRKIQKGKNYYSRVNGKVKKNLK